MKPAAFRYRAVGSLEEALDVLSEHGEDVTIIAGGQSLMPLLNLRLARPEILLDINRIADLAFLEITADAVKMGAMTRAATVEHHAEVKQVLPVVPQAIAHIGHPQIRNRTTIGGNVAHADPSSELPGVLACLEGSVQLQSKTRGTRTVGWEDFFQSVFTTDKQPDELVTGVTFPITEPWRYSYQEVAARHGDYPVAGVTVGILEQAGVLEQVRISVVGVADRPVRLRTLEERSSGMAATAATAAVLGRFARNEVPASDDVHVSAEYRKAIVGTLVSRTVSSLLEEIGP